MNLSGHVWTIGGLVARSLSPARPPASVPWTTTFEDPTFGSVRLSGRLSRPPGAGNLLVLVHGLGGSSESTYMVEMARAAGGLGLASLRLNLRGADHQGGDFYHGGLTDDLHATLADPVLAGFERIVCLGFSLGAHVVVRFATEVEDPRVAAVAGVCPVLDLAAGVRMIEDSAWGIYRFYVLRGLKAMHRALGAGGGPGVDRAGAQAARTLREFDTATVVPRFGFRDADDYYRRASVASSIRHLARPALLLVTEKDPMAPAESIRGFEPEAPPRLTIRWLQRGGHLTLPRQLDLGFAGPKGWRRQTLCWLLAEGLDDRIAPR